jgi:hypothetical protein
MTFAVLSKLQEVYRRFDRAVLSRLWDTSCPTSDLDGLPSRIDHGESNQLALVTTVQT